MPALMLCTHVLAAALEAWELDCMRNPNKARFGNTCAANAKKAVQGSRTALPVVADADADDAGMDVDADEDESQKNRGRAQPTLCLTIRHSKPQATLSHLTTWIPSMRKI